LGDRVAVARDIDGGGVVIASLGLIGDIIAAIDCDRSAAVVVALVRRAVVAAARLGTSEGVAGSRLSTVEVVVAADLGLRSGVLVTALVDVGLVIAAAGNVLCGGPVSARLNDLRDRVVRERGSQAKADQCGGGEKQFTHVDLSLSVMFPPMA
jgi:hypothetical protein